MSKGEPSSPRLKLVIRRLPPTLPEDVFWNSVAPWVTDTSCSWKRFIKGRPSEGPYDHALHSRAYCLMSDTEALVNFHRSFDGHVFRSKMGAEYQAVVEFAPVQKTPLKSKPKTDARQGTIDEDPDFNSYLESLQAPQPKAIIEPSLPSSQPTTTPLLEYLRSQGAKGGKKKVKAESSSTDVARNAAVAAVTASAARRNPKDQGGAMMAGKGRSVVVAPGGSDAASKAKSRNKKGKGAARGAVEETVPPPTAKDFPALAVGPSSTPKPAPTPTSQPAPPNGRSTPAHDVGPPLRGRGGRDRGGAGGRGDPKAPNDSMSGRSGDEGASASAGRGGRGRGRGRGGGRDDGEREPRVSVTGLLTRPIGESGGRGGRRGRGGLGGGTGAPDPRTARIDA